MFDHDSLPSRVYRYGARPPVANAELVSDQMMLAHRYKNRLVELERSRRAKVDEALVRICPELAATELAIAEAGKAIETARGEIDRASAKARRKVMVPEAARAISAAKVSLRTLRAKRMELRGGLFGIKDEKKRGKGEPVRWIICPSEAWLAEQEKIKTWAKAEGARCRGESGLYWGTYLIVENSVSRSGPPPRFERWDGGGHLAVQIQGGMSVAEAFGNGTGVRIEPMPTEGGKSARLRTRVHFRVGSDEGRGPVFAVVPVVLHRPMPEDARVKWVYLIRRRIATHCEWSVQFVLSRERGWDRPDSASDGDVGINAGWRVRDDGSLRVAYWVGSDGAEGELALPPGWLNEMKKTRDIRSIRDTNLNAARGDLARWVKERLSSGAGVPEWLSKAAQTLPQWRSQARLAALVLGWRNNRFEGDAETFEALEAWRKRDKHLYEYEGNLRDQLQRRREDLYRVFAAKLRRLYRTAHIAKMDLRDFHELPEAEEGSADGALREHVRDACLSLLTKSIKESMAMTMEHPAEDITRRCPKCGTVGDFDRLNLVRTCPGCGDQDDQDRVAAINLLRHASAPVV